ncbi:MAG: heparinase II/III family protein [Aliidongia sp.]
MADGDACYAEAVSAPPDLLVARQSVSARDPLDQRIELGCVCCPGSGSAPCSPAGRAALDCSRRTVFLDQLYGHQTYLAAFESPDSSSNNHLTAELAGLAVAAVAFPWFAESADWARRASAHLRAEARRQTASMGSIWSRRASITASCSNCSGRLGSLRSWPEPG